MPVFDVGQRTQSPTNEVGAVKMGYGAVSTLHAAGQQAWQQVDQIAKAWDDAEATAQYTTAKNNLTAQLMEYDADVKNLQIGGGSSGDFFKSYAETKSDYANKLAMIKQNGSALSNPRARNKFAQDSEIAFVGANIAMEAAFRDKMISHQKVEIERAGDMHKRAYVGGTLAAKAYFEGLVNENAKVGFLNEKEAYLIKEDIKNWEQDRILAVAEANPLMALSTLEENKEISPEEKTKTRNSILAIQKQKDIALEVRSLATENAELQRISPLMSGDGSYTEKRDELLSSKPFLSERAFNAYMQLNDSAHKEDAKTNIATYSQIIADLAEFGSEYPTDRLKNNADNSREFFKKYQDMSLTIAEARAAGKLGKVEFEDLNKRLATSNSMPEKKGTARTAQYDEYSMGRVVKDIKKRAKSKEAGDVAIAEYYDTMKAKAQNGMVVEKKEMKTIIDAIIKSNNDKAIDKKAKGKVSKTQKVFRNNKTGREELFEKVGGVWKKV